MIADLLRHKARAEASEAKLTALKAAAAGQRRESGRRQHRSVWAAEASRLRREEQTAERAVEAHVQQLLDVHRVHHLRDHAGECAAMADARDADHHRTLATITSLRRRLAAGSGTDEAAAAAEALARLRAEVDTEGRALEEERRVLEADLAGLATSGTFAETVAEAPRPPTIGSLVAELDRELADEGCAVNADLRAMLLHSLTAREAEATEQLTALRTEIDTLRGDVAHWGDADAARYRKLRDEYRVTDDAAGRARLLDRLALELPHRTAADLSHYHWTQERLGFVRRRLRTAQEQWQATLRSLVDNAGAALRAAAAMASEQSERRAAATDRKSHRAVLQATCVGARAVRLEREQQRRARVRADQEAAEKAALESRARREEDLRRRRGDLEVYRREQAAAAETLRAAAEREAALGREEAARQQQYNAARVAYRDEAVGNRREQRLRDLWALHEEDTRREQRLEALREKVRIHVPWDEARITQPTASNRQRQEAGVPPPPAWGVAGGYSDQTLFRDPRFRLQEALGTAGLLHTDYARCLLAQTGPAPKPHLVSTVLQGP